MPIIINFLTAQLNFISISYRIINSKNMEKVKRSFSESAFKTMKDITSAS